MKNRLNAKDLINVGLFTILIFIFSFIGGMIGFIPVLMPVMPFIGGIFIGPVSMLFATKIKKPGMLFIQQMITALIFVVMGHGPWILLTALVAGALGEWMLKRGNYNSIKHARWAFVLANISIAGNLIPIFISRDHYIQTLIDGGYGQEYADTMMSVMPDWAFLPIVLLGMVGVYIGCTIGIRILKKHFVKAGMVKDF